MYEVSELSIIRINENPHLEIRALSSGESFAVIDDFLAAPDELRKYAIEREQNFSMPPKSYPGVVMDIDDEPMRDIYRYIRSTLGRQFSFLRGGAEFMSMLSMTTLQADQLSNLQRLCHTDPPAKSGRRNFAFVLYLFDNEQLGGTGFYRWKEKQAIIEATALESKDPVAALAFLKERFPTYQTPPCYMTESTEIAERLDLVTAKFNRLVFYSGDIPHSAQIASPGLLPTDIRVGRLTLNCFASVRPE